MKTFELCENTGFYLRIALIGPAGSGKTYSALSLATELGYERVAVVDTENRSARRYAKAFLPHRFQSLELERFSPADYIEAIHEAERARVEVLIIDSLSHAWAGKGGVLEMVDQSARRQARGGTPSSFSGWREVTPEHNRLVEALVQAQLHLIVTMRTKTEYVIDKDEKGRAVPRKVGLQPVQRDGLEYEFDIVGDVSPEHEFAISKTRLSSLTDQVIPRPGAALAKELRAWVDGAEMGPDWLKMITEAKTDEEIDAAVAALSRAAGAGKAPPAQSPAGQVLEEAIVVQRDKLARRRGP